LAKSLIWSTGSMLKLFLAYSTAEEEPRTRMRMGWSTTSSPSVWAGQQECSGGGQCVRSGLVARVVAR
jgi:hypothetical protein